MAMAIGTEATPTFVSGELLVEGVSCFIGGRTNLRANLGDVLCSNCLKIGMSEDVIVQGCPITNEELLAVRCLLSEVRNTRTYVGGSM